MVGCRGAILAIKIFFHHDIVNITLILADTAVLIHGTGTQIALISARIVTSKLNIGGMSCILLSFICWGTFLSMR